MSLDPKQLLSSALKRYGLAVMTVTIALGLRVGMLYVHPLRSPFLLLFAAIMVSAVYGGLGPGILATILAGIGSGLLITEGSLDRTEFSVFVLEGLFLSLLGAMLHRARRQAELADLAARRLEQKILDISEDERRRIGHDLHDGLGQHLTGIALLAKALNQKLSAAGNPQSQQAAKIAELVNESIGWTRDLARGLSPVTLQEEGLQPALEELASNASSLLGIRCSVQYSGGSSTIPLNEETSMHLYRIAQEAINNSVKHGKAKNVRIRLDATNGQIHLVITDDGCGLSAKTRASPGIGLQIMQYRARMIGATLTLSGTADPGGTIVTCSVPAVRSQDREQLE